MYIPTRTISEKGRSPVEPAILNFPLKIKHNNYYILKSLINK